MTDLLHKFILAPKPDWMLASDVIVTAALIASDGTYPGHAVMCARCGIAEAALLRCYSKLSAAGWLVKEKGTPTLIMDRIPQGGDQ
jgi:hypothetical protein